MTAILYLLEFTTFFKLNVFEKDSYDGEVSSLAA